MKLILKRRYREEDIEILRKAIRRKYGRMEKIKKLMQIKKCAMPDLGEAYLMKLAIDEGSGIEEEVIIEDRKVLNHLSAKRFELIEFLNKNKPMSLKELAGKLGRDYKNVYDDVSSLSNYFVVSVVKFGRESVPVGVVEDMQIRV